MSDEMEIWFERGVTDGLPVVPPTRERVERMIEATARPRGTLVAEVPPNFGRATVEKLAVNEDHPGRLEERFFVALKKATVEGYYTSAVGIHQELEYKGNTALLEFPGCTHPEHKT